VLGVNGRTQPAAPLDGKEAPLCRVVKDDDAKLVRLVFTPRADSALRDKEPPPEWAEFREYLTASDFVTANELPAALTLAFHLASPPPSPR
jgi:hypothetical protein